MNGAAAHRIKKGEGIILVDKDNRFVFPLLPVIVVRKGDCARNRNPTNGKPKINLCRS